MTDAAQCADMAVPEVDIERTGSGELDNGAVGWLMSLSVYNKPRSREAAKPQLRPRPRARLLPN